MGNRITWQNVDAPNFDSSLKASARGGQMVSGAFQNMGTNLRGFQGERDAEQAQADADLMFENSAAAVGKAMGITDVGSWDKASKEGIFQSLGINPRDINGDTLEMIAGRRDDLFANANSQSINNSRDQSTETAGYNLGQKQITDSWKIEDRKRTVAQQASDDANAAMRQEALAGVDQMANSLQPSEMTPWILEQGYSAEKEAAWLAAADEVNPAHWDTSPAVKRAMASNPMMVNTNTALDYQKTELKRMVSANPGLRWHAVGQQAYSGAPGKTAAELQSRMKKQFTAAGEDESSFMGSFGDMEADFNKLQKEFSKVAPETIAAVMESTVKAGGFLWNKTKLNDSGIRTILGDLNNEANRAANQELRAEYNRENAKLESFRGEWDELQEEYAIAATRGNDERADRALARMTEMGTEYTYEARIANAPPGAGGESLPLFSGGGGSGSNGVPSPKSNNAAPSGSLTPAERAANSNAVGQNILKDVRDLSDSTDTMVGQVLQGGYNAAAGVQGAIAGGVSMFSPERGANLFGQADAIRQNGEGVADFWASRQDAAAPATPATPSPVMSTPDNLSQALSAGRGPQSDGPSSQASGAQTPGYQQAQDAFRGSPAETIQMIGDEVGLPPQQVQQVSAAISMLQARNDLDEGRRTQAEGILSKFMSDIQNSGPISDEVMGLMDLIPEMLNM